MPQSQTRKDNLVTHGGSAGHLFNFSVLQMLENVKDNDGRLYINPDGTGNFEVVAKGGENYEQKASENNLKAEQLKIILDNNPAHDDYHTWLRSEEDIHTAEEVFGDNVQDEEFKPTNSYFTAQDA